MVSVLSNIFEKLMWQVLVQRNSLLAYIIMRGISVSNHLKKLSLPFL